MSGLGSYTSLFPGQCTPVILFVFLNDIHETGPTPYESPESRSSNQSTLGRTNLPSKGSGSIVVLSRPVTKSEGGFKKKLQSSLEAQIRFSIKKCRYYPGQKRVHPVFNGPGPISNHLPLFSLDGSKVVLLLDKVSNNSGKSLDFATSIVENVLEGISTSDSLLLENHSQSSNKKYILSLKEFIYKQCDILRGRMSVSVSGGGGGGGMVGAAAAASVALGKPSLTPELPSLDVWLTSSQTILHGLLSAKLVILPESEQTKRRSRQQNSVSVSPTIKGGGQSQTKVNDTLELAATCLDNSKGLNSKFSIYWCQKALPVAKDVCLHDLPPCYPTSQHESHLSKALTFFNGFVFLHACACGRSRKLRLDPFDFETANVSFSCYPECNNTEGPFQSKSVSLTIIGGSRYYQPSKGLLQSGFSNTEKFLLKWKFFLEKHKDSRVEVVSDVKVKKTGDLHNGVEVNSKNNNLDERKNNSLNPVVVYIGFEHECPCGHRFIFTSDHLKGLGSIYAVDESVENLDCRGVELSKIDKHGGHGKVHRHSNGMV
ncbi:hypothetical protein L1887_19006 [Cichorium endivia]|nr:hypothetical protein L1887_19006 [Cichorium endivia]